MKIYSWNFINKLPIQDELILCVGSFETLHLGHYELFKIAKSLKAMHSEKKMAIMIFQSPVKNGKVQNKKALQPKARLYTLAELGFDYAFVIDLNEEIMNMDYHMFIKALIDNHVTDVVCGPDFRYGFNRMGTIDKLKKHFNVSIADERKVNKRKISSTLINELIAEGNINGMNELLLQNYAFITNMDHFEYAYPENLNRLRSGIYIVNAVIDGFEYHGITLINLIKKTDEEDNAQNNMLYLFDLQIVPSKYQEIYIEFLHTIRYINNERENSINENDLEIGRNFFIKK
ncbi:FAD synthase [Metamycoplasma neophronis]|uniref:FAD synthase n=1 Tax=Metamycoplasma neophronis TaxID=872983 RepID=A0ABY2YZ84_9BACT|nr:riboflavin biosynthesis protein [Metamycoplasma neophronis]TPR53263.1 riboflavin biosynthesis protein [Metamycoplasma neophronis]